MLGLFAPRAASGQGWDVPKPVVDLKPGTTNYRVTIEAQGQTATMAVTRVTKSENGAWLITNTTRAGDHVQTDEITVARKSLVIRKRSFRAGDAIANLEFKGTRVTGVIADSKSKVDVDTDHRVVKEAISVPNLGDPLAVAELTSYPAR
ncbi:MAG TPA: hypothetical protein VLJ83_11090 [Gemmatimonadaceae bacterium]|nr:hypothetical protein [Gemmatimonadaceae bacterium]